MADFKRIRDYLEAHRDELANSVSESFRDEFDSLSNQWDREEDETSLLELTLRVLGRYPAVCEALEAEGLLPEGWQAEPPPAPVREPASVSPASPTPTGGAAAPPTPVPPPTGGNQVDKPQAVVGTDERLALWDKGMAIGKEFVTGCLGILIVLVTLIVALVAVLTTGTDEAWARAKDVLLILSSLVGVVLGYYFGRIPGEAQAAKAETVAEGARGEAEAARSELDQTRAEVRGMLTEAKVATSRGALAEELELSPAQARRLWELVNR